MQLFEGFRHQGIKPDIVTYSALISACEKGRDRKTALRLFEEMQQKGIKPNCKKRQNFTLAS